MKVEGSCHCGKISYEGEVDPDTVAICHCTDCQKLSGSVYRIGIPAPAQTFVLKGEPKSYVKTAESGTKRVHAFCPDCGSPVYSTQIGTPTSYTLRVGALKQRHQLNPPKRQIWTRSALSWSGDIRNIEKHDRG
jgi:hypothetical protein